ncbi:MAG: SRPBCC domain-containing protein [Flavobacteriales bacterium]|nr:SRPBCC domain-containing protein [Flavobacteriales bacterium]MCB9448035.1 SRPBCC domain-containing protein [Flavobacteriales bacterium]
MSKKERYSLEFIVKSSPKILFNCISTPSGLSEWFSDDVNVRDQIYTFLWDGDEQQAELLDIKPNESIRFHWLDDEDPDTYFEFRIAKDDLTGEIALVVTDHADKAEKDEAMRLWNSQIHDLMHVIGS